MRLTRFSPVIPAPEPGSFAALMELYERNYLQLRRLIPDLRHWQGSRCSRVAHCLPLHVDIVEQSRYTSTVRLYYLFDADSGRPRRAPDLLIRIYYDARSVEVLSGGVGLTRCLAARSGACLEKRWRINRFLFKWLGYCAHRGHCFEENNA
ncbi:MAG: DUF1249 domain-containing protein [Halothiobacillaceae bacterium]|nr:DUF1249 domain-containing protein [Halothiobacillaceae bacterium]